MLLHALTFSATLAALALALPEPILQDYHAVEERDGAVWNIFHHAASGAKIEFVKNSGICETTKGVNQYSGYVNVGTMENMFFWFFEARESPKTAPLATWLNGGPGCSSLVGLFVENGPCHFVNGEKEPSLNPHSWNSHANMLYIDQPIGAGFSYGRDPVESTVTAAPLVWKLLQAFLAKFPEYESREFGLWTESYGGHYGPGFAAYFEAQNAAIESRAAKGEKINLVALGVNNGWYDGLRQYPAFIDYSVGNKYKKLIDEEQAAAYREKMKDTCAPALERCTALTGHDRACLAAQQTCFRLIEEPLANTGDFDVYDVRAPKKDPNPPMTFIEYLNRAEVKKKIGAKGRYSMCSDRAGSPFYRTGDNSRSLLPTLGKLVKGGLRTVIWAGDADWICNYMGGQAVVNAIDWPGQDAFKAKTVQAYTVEGHKGGLFKTHDNLSWLQVFGAGHEVPYYAPEVALQVFRQTMSGRELSAT